MVPLRAPLRCLAVVAVVSGCGPSAECRRYVACQRAWDPTVSVDAYDDGGACWTTLQTADACTQQCAEALDAFTVIPDAPAACRDHS